MNQRLHAMHVLLHTSKRGPIAVQRTELCSAHIQMISRSTFILTYGKHLPPYMSVHFNSFEFFPTPYCLLLPHVMTWYTPIICCYVYGTHKLILKESTFPMIFVIPPKSRGFLFWFIPLWFIPINLFRCMHGQWLNNKLLCHTLTMYHISTNMNLFIN